MGSLESDERPSLCENPNEPPDLQLKIAMNKVRDSISTRQIENERQESSLKQQNVHKQLMLNSELSIVKSARQYKVLKADVKYWNQKAQVIAISTLIFGGILLGISLSDFLTGNAPLLLRVACSVFSQQPANIALSMSINSL